MNFKGIIKNLVFSFRLSSQFYFKKLYKNMADDALYSRLLQIGHRFDHYLMKHEHPKCADIWEYECLLWLAKKNKIVFDDSIRWSLAMYLMAKFQTLENYEVRKKIDEGIESVELADLSNCIKSRRSVRKWNQKAVEIKKIESIINISKWSPSSCNRQTTRVLVVESEKDRKFVGKYFPNKFWHNAPCLLLVLSETNPYGTNEKFFPYLDSGAFIQNLLLLLHASGYGACWLGFKGWDALGNVFMERSDYNCFYDYFRVPETMVPISMIAVGEYDDIPNAPARKSLDKIILRRS